MRAGDHHEGERDRQALIRHVGLEDDPRHGEIDDGADDQQSPAGRMKLQCAMAQAKAGRKGHDPGEQQGREMRVDLDDIEQAIELAAELPHERRSQAPGRAHHQERQYRQERQAGGNEIDERPPLRARKARSIAAAPVMLDQAAGLEGGEPDPIYPDREQVAEEQRQHEQQRDCEPDDGIVLAQADPGRHGPEREAHPEDVVHGSDEEHVVVEQRKRDQRQNRPASEKLAIERKRARYDEHEARDGVDLPGSINAHQPRQRRNDHVHHQVGNDLPVDVIEL